MPSTYIETILNCFTTLDIEKLRFYLKEEYSYQDTTKEVFLNEIGKIFDAHKNSGDTALLIYSGKCAGETCGNCGKGGYRFVGNHSKNYLSLIFIEDGDDIQDIFTCSEFKTDANPGELSGEASMFIHRDDMVDFDKTPEYWAKVNSAETAYNEIVTTPPTTLDFEQMQYWLSKHSFTNAKIGTWDIFEGPMRWTDFSRLYSQLQELSEYMLGNEKELREARRQFRSVKEEELIKWLLKYEALHEKAPFDFKYGIAEAGEKYVLENVSNPILFSGEHFCEIFGFLNSYYKHHWELIEKYSIYTEEEVSEIYNDEKYHGSIDDINSLRFHLEKRKEAKELGIELPLFLKKTEE